MTSLELKGKVLTKRTAAKHKIDRRMGENIWGRPKSPVNKRVWAWAAWAKEKRKAFRFWPTVESKAKAQRLLWGSDRETV